MAFSDEYGHSSEMYMGFTRSDFAFVCVTLYSFFAYGEGTSSSRRPMKPAYHHIKSGGVSTGHYGVGAVRRAGGGSDEEGAGGGDAEEEENDGSADGGGAGASRWYEDIVDWPVRLWGLGKKNKQAGQGRDDEDE
jgi:hypothetical protein